MTPGDVLRFVIRAVHTGAAIAWLGGGLLYLLTRANLRAAANSDAWTAHERLIRSLMGRSFALLLASGAYLIFDRLADPRIGAAYIVALIVKLALVAAIGWMVSARRPSRVEVGRPDRRLLSPAWMTVALGVGATLLGVLLTVIYEIYEAEAARP